jgi:DNA-directed RNA polymerase specialized sigma subunit
MKEVDIEALPGLVKQGQMTKEEGARQIWIDIYFNPKRYGLGQFSEDRKSDFLISLRTRFERLFDEYKPHCAKFRTYIRGCIANSMISWYRKEGRITTAQDSLTSCMEIDFENKQYHYCMTESEQSIMEQSEKEYHRVIDFKGIKRRIAEKTYLILLLKSCYEENDAITSKISEYTGIKKDILSEKLCRLRKSVEHKAVKRERLIQRRDNAFYFHRKYCLELIKLNSKTIYYKLLKDRYQSQTLRWKKQNSLLSCRYLPEPSNKQIADELNMTERQVCFYISHAERVNPSSCEKRSEK